MVEGASESFQDRVTEIFRKQCIAFQNEYDVELVGSSMGH